MLAMHENVEKKSKMVLENGKSVKKKLENS